MRGREVSTTEIVRDALRTSKKVFIPYIYASMDDPKQKIMDMLRLKDEADLDSLKPDPWGIPSLSAENIEDRENALGGRGVSVASLERRAAHGLDLVFMPGMAFDNAHNRLGHGRGFYDKYLSQIRRLSQEAGPAQLPTLGESIAILAGSQLTGCKVGLALREQLLQDDQVVPTTEDDWKVDKLIIPDD